MTRFLSLILSLTLAGTAAAQAQPPEADKPAPVVPPKTSGKFKAVAPLIAKAGHHIVIDATSAKGDVDFEFDQIAFPKERATYSEGKKLLVLSTPVNGTYRITVYSWDDKAKERIEVKVTGGSGPDPVPDPIPIPTDPLEALKMEVRAGFAKMDARLLLLEKIKPIPPPDPKPDPKPPPDPAPIPLAGLRVLIIHEETEPDKLSAGQRAIMFGATMRTFLDSKCVMGTDGKTKEWRIFDKDVDTTRAEKHWAAAMQRKPASIPWIIVSNHPRGGYEGPLPANVEAAQKLISKFAE